MPTVLRVDGLRIVIYLNDHPPAHVHVLGPGWIVVVNLLGPNVREAIACDARDAGRALEVVARHRDRLLAEWRRLHG
jgi:hypothetical protein